MLMKHELFYKQKYDKSKLINIEKEILDKINRRKKLYDFIETSNLEISDISPRLKELNEQINELEDSKKLLELENTQNKIPVFTINELQNCIEDFNHILIEGSLSKRKAFISSFIKKIWIDYPTVTIEYTIPINKKDNSNTEVLVYAKNGSPGRIRTYNISVNSRTLYH